MSSVRVRSIRRAEAGLFAGLGPGPKRTGRVLIQLWDECRSCPEWCFVVEQDGRPCGRVGFWMLPSLAGVFHASWLELPWEQDFERVGTRLWRDALIRMRQLGATSFETMVGSDETFAARRRAFLRGVGMRLLQKKIDYVLPAARKTRRDGRRLVFRSPTEADDPAFVEALGRVTRGTLDREDALDLRECGECEAGRRLFAILHDIDSLPERRLLAFDRSNHLVGLVAPQMLSDRTGAINYIGVIPEQRGKGYVDDLLACGIALLRKAGAKLIIADVDTVNHPVRAAVERAGFQAKCEMWIYRR